MKRRAVVLIIICIVGLCLHFSRLICTTDAQILLYIAKEKALFQQNSVRPAELPFTWQFGIIPTKAFMCTILKRQDRSWWQRMLNQYMFSIVNSEYTVIFTFWLKGEAFLQKVNNVWYVELYISVAPRWRTEYPWILELYIVWWVIDNLHPRETTWDSYVNSYTARIS